MMKKTITMLAAGAMLCGAFVSCDAKEPAPTETTQENPNGMESDSTTEPETTPILTQRAENRLSLLFSIPTAVGADGSEIERQGWKSTDYIVIPDGTACYEFNLASAADLSSLAFYAADRTFLSGVSTGLENVDTYVAVDGTTVINGFVPVPENALFVRFTAMPAYEGNDALTCNLLFPNYHSENADPSAAQRGKIVCIGDSLTEGDYGGVRGVANVHAENYPLFLSRFLGCETVNAGKCGYTASAMLAYYRAGNVDVSGADAILILLGSNAGLPAPQINAYKQLISLIQKDNPQAPIILVTPPNATIDPTKVNYGYADHVASACDGVFSIATELGLPVFNLHEEAGIDFHNEGVLQPGDGLHFHAFGYSRIAAYLAEKLVAAYPDAFQMQMSY